MGPVVRTDEGELVGIRDRFSTHPVPVDRRDPFPVFGSNDLPERVPDQIGRGTAGHPEECLPEEAPANAAGDLVIDGWVRGLPARFPEKAGHVVVEERLPIIKACRSRKSMVHGSLIRMVELVHGKGVLVDPPGSMHDMVPES